MSAKSMKRDAVTRVLGELAIIIVGVLVALQAEEWADNRHNREREQDQLQALADDFAENVARIDRVMARQRRTLQAVGAVVRFADGLASRPAPDSLRTLLVWANTFQRFEPVLGAYDGLVASGDLSLVSSRELRAALAGFASEVRGGFEEEAQADQYHVAANRLATEVIPLWRTLPKSYHDAFGYDAPSGEIDVWPLFLNREYVGLIAMLGAVEANYYTYFTRLRGSMVRIQELIRLQQGGSATSF